MAARKTGLGRGLGALFEDAAISIGDPLERESRLKENVDKSISDQDEIVIQVNINQIKPNESQPRKNFDKEKLEELASSILEHGVIQPLVLRPYKDGKSFQLVAGERRWRAARLAGLKLVPAIVRELTEEENIILSIIENIQREDLNPIEEAEAVNTMMKTYRLTQEEVSKSLGKSRPYIANTVRLLKLPEEIREMVREEVLSQSHARALLTLPKAKQLELAGKAVKGAWSVREIETRVAKVESDKKGRKDLIKKAEDNDGKLIERELKDLLGTRVNIKDNKGRGRIEIEYYTKEERERLIDLLKSIK